MSLRLEAERHGLRTHRMGGFFDEKVAKAGSLQRVSLSSSRSATKGRPGG